MTYNIPNTVSTIYFHSGNVLNAKDLSQMAGRNSTEEVVDCLTYCLSKCLSPSQPLVLNENTIVLKCDKYYTSDCEHGHSSLSISVKIFLATSQAESLEDSFKSLYKELNEQAIDSVILSFNHSQGILQLSDLLTLWVMIEGYVMKNKISRIGVSDIDINLFISLYKNSSIKPTIYQINLEKCCFIPEALQEFTKDNEIQLLTHNDSKDILPETRLAQIFGGQTGPKVNIPKLEWMIRYISFAKYSSVFTRKGYIVCLKRSNNESTD